MHIYLDLASVVVGVFLGALLTVIVIAAISIAAARKKARR